MKTKYILTALILIIGILIFTPGLEEKENIQIVGSSSIQGISEELSEKYMKKTNNIDISVQSGGSSMGLNSILKDNADIGMYSTEINNKNINATTIAMDAIVIITHPSNNITNLPKEKLKDIFTGKTNNWKQINGNNEEITVVSREEGSGTRNTIKEKLLNNQSITSNALIQSSTGSLIQTVSTNPHAIGYASLTEIRNNNVKTITIDNKEATTENIKNGYYILQRPFIYLTKNPDKNTRQYIDWILSPEGQEIIEKEGLIPVN
ncbi:phosphate ABC transporter substrate-binding protein [Methanosphaera sp. ISO3-F5]|uniref:phosphate ABC transporter substrate-binding protein n=1 Tax=Methanosphaera sp. ISO3-F5 TaxID=1452353 RepID=UPI002B259325|nr:phosphate ABC transporter substrate-binding protein [Methanosphaera sp. ISO3-F5]WQH63766.1 phosphate ABC transporter substrate-binding protein [Methanosphaera sp. ISO3-F5]